MAIIEGTGIVDAGKEARAKALAKSKQVTSDKKIAAEYKVDPIDRMIRDIDRASKRLGSQESTGAVKETGRGMGDRFNPFTDRVDASNQIKKPSFFSPGGGIYDSRNEVAVASTDLSSLRSDDTTESTFGTSFTDQASANIADASIYKQKEDSIYRPTDSIYDSLKEFKFPKIQKEKPTTYTDSSGDVYTSKPYTESSPGFKRYGDTDAQLIRRKKDDAKFSQPYSEASNREAFMKERNAYLKDTGAYRGMISTEKKKPIRGFGDALGAALGLNDREYTTKTDRFIESSANQDYKEFRKEMRDKVFSESPYGKDVEKKYYYKDFQQPGVYRSEKEVQSYIKDRGAALTGMPSNFKGGVSGIGKETDNLSKDPRYQSTAGNFAKEKETSTLQKVGDFIGRVTRPPSAAAGELTGIDKALSDATKKLNLGSSGHSIDGVYMPSMAEAYKREKTGIEKGIESVGKFFGRITRPPAAEGAENPLSRTVPSGSFNISQEGKDQAAINRGIKAAEATGIPTGVAAQGGVTTQAARDAGIKARQDAAQKRAKNMADAQGIAARNPNVSIVGGRAVAANDSGKARAQAAAVNRKIQGKTISQVKAENKKKMQDAAKKRNEAFNKSKAQKKQSGGGFGGSTSTNKKSTTKKSAPSKKSSPSKSAKSKGSTSSSGVGSARGKAAAKGRTKKSKSKGSSSKGSSSKGSSSKGSKSSSSGPGSSRGKAAAKGRTRRRSRRCDIRCKYNIMPLTNMNLIKDDLAEVAYFVKELQA